MPRIVDGDNLLGGWPGRTRGEADKRQLSHELARLARQEGRDLLLVFDGPQPLAVAFGGRTVFAGQGKTAVDLILEHLRGQQDPHGWIVVTDDRRLGDQARWVGARVERCDTLRRRLGAVPRRSPRGRRPRLLEGRVRGRLTTRAG
jgi:hypothetical protein